MKETPKVSLFIQVFPLGSGGIQDAQKSHTK